MAQRQIVLKQSRLIPFSITDRGCRRIAVYCSILSTGFEVYQDFKRYDPKSLYGYAQIVSGTYVLSEVPITQVNQEIIVIENLFADLTQQITCARKNIRDVQILVEEGGTEVPPSYPVPLKLPLVRETGIAFKLFNGTSASVQILTDALTQGCDIATERTDPNDEREQGVDEPERATDTDGDGIPDAPYGLGDDGNQLDTDEQPPSEAATPRSGGYWRETVYFSNGHSDVYEKYTETDPTTVWTLGGICFMGVPGESGAGQGTDGADISGLQVFKDGVYSYCSEDYRQTNVVNVTFDYVYP